MRRQWLVEDFKERIPGKERSDLTGHADHHAENCPARSPGQPHSDRTAYASHPLLHYFLTWSPNTPDARRRIFDWHQVLYTIKYRLDSFKRYPDESRKPYRALRK